MATMVELTCGVCGESFTRLASQHNRRDKANKIGIVCCSKACVWIANGVHKKSKRNYVEMVCDKCGATFNRRVGHYNYNKSKGLKKVFCSKDCWSTRPSATRRPQKDGYIGTNKNRFSAEEQEILKHMSPKNGCIAEHRAIMALHQGRPLKSSEVVHHINGVRHDNRIENLQLCARDIHSKLHMEVNYELARLKQSTHSLDELVKIQEEIIKEQDELIKKLEAQLAENVVVDVRRYVREQVKGGEE